MMIFLAGLNSQFEIVKSQNISSAEISSLQDTFTRVLRTEISASVASSVHDSSALISRGSRGDIRSRGKGSRINQSKNEEGVICYYCNEPGHNRYSCQK